MFIRMVPVKTLNHQARGADYELLVYQVVETGEYRIYIAKGGVGVGELFAADENVIADAKATGGPDVLEELVRIAKSDIDCNEFNQY